MSVKNLNSLNDPRSNLHTMEARKVARDFISVMRRLIPQYNASFPTIDMSKILRGKSVKIMIDGKPVAYADDVSYTLSGNVLEIAPVDSNLQPKLQVQLPRSFAKIRPSNGDPSSSGQD